MLHHAKVMEALLSLQDDLFADNSDNIAIARASWKRIAADPLFALKIRQINVSWLLPTWQEAVDTVYDVQPMEHPYHVIAIDGSQIYPDRHQGSSCYLINIGSVDICYGQTSGVQCTSKPYVYAGRQEDELEETAVDMVNAKRQELELQAGLELCSKQFYGAQPELFLFDGSLIFWHLVGKSGGLKDAYLRSHLQLMEQLYQRRIVHAGYISLPKSKELVNLIRVELCNFVAEGCTQHKAVDHIVDATVAGFFLQAGQRTTLFKSNAIISKIYPDHLVPYFFYLHIGCEMVRIELPAWVAQDVVALDTVARIAYDQAIKGNGYPVVLAEAHEQAVVKGPDREFFYHMVHKLAIVHNKQQLLSQKSNKKRIMGI